VADTLFYSSQDVMNFSRASLGKDVEPAEARMLWVDKLGFDIRVVTGGNGKQKVLDVRLPFPAAANTAQEVRVAPFPNPASLFAHTRR
jgi:hypothetical protein